MIAAASPPIGLLAPAKLNLGLEVMGRRPDGYHDLVTIFQAVDVVDRLTLRPDAALRLSCDDRDLAAPDNLALRALAALRAHAGTAAGARINLVKGIPVAAGLGGASSDAAAALLGGRRLWDVAISDAALAGLAAALGSDVPFFLRGGTALATGRGEQLTPLLAPAARYVVVSPRLRIPRKTSALYGALTATDFSDGTTVRRQAARLAAGEPLDPDLLPNAFARALYALRPELADLPTVLRRHGAPAVALSGAGPSHYAVLPEPGAATRLAAVLSAALGAAARVLVAAPFVQPEVPEAT